MASSVLDAIAERVRSGSDLPALTIDGRTLSYAELWGRSAQVCARLRHIGVGSEDVVGLLCERSSDLVAGMLGILRAGAAYVPLEPMQPAARLRRTIDHANCRALVHEPRLAAQARDLCERPAIDTSDDSSAAAAAPAPSPRGRDLAYVMYTSGSTGAPKGVMIEHDALLNRLEWMQELLRLGPDDTVLHKTPFTFDVSVWELLLPLMAGARIVLAQPRRHPDVAYLGALVDAESVSVAHFVPSMLQRFVGALDAGVGSGLRTIVSSGEVLTPGLASAVRANGTRTLHNLYGPTEATIDATWWTCDGSERETVPIGHPIRDLDAFVVDDRGVTVNDGEVGEIAICGRGLARGYLGDPQLTAERFRMLERPDGPVRAYLTGDRGRVGALGALEFLGRADRQVKLRGYRIEPGEIEAALLAEPQVRQANVELESSASGAARLVAHVAVAAPMTDDARGLLGGRLREALRSTLPDYMVPALVRVLDAMPTTDSGKLAVDGLQRAGEPGDAAESAAAATPTEAALIAIWEEALEVDGLSAASDFFELGGDSLAAAVIAAEVAERIRGMAGSDFDPLVAIFETPTIAELAATIDARRAGV